MRRAGNAGLDVKRLKRYSEKTRTAYRHPVGREERESRGRTYRRASRFYRPSRPRYPRKFSAQWADSFALDKLPSGRGSTDFAPLFALPSELDPATSSVRTSRTRRKRFSEEEKTNKKNAFSR